MGTKLNNFLPIWSLYPNMMTCEVTTYVAPHQ